MDSADDTTSSWMEAAATAAASTGNKNDDDVDSPQQNTGGNPESHDDHSNHPVSNNDNNNIIIIPSKDDGVVPPPIVAQKKMDYFTEDAPPFPFPPADGKVYFYPAGGAGNQRRQKQSFFRNLLRRYAQEYYDTDMDKRTFVQQKIMIHFPNGAYVEAATPTTQEEASDNRHNGVHRNESTATTSTISTTNAFVKANAEVVFKMVSQKLRDVYNKEIKKKKRPPSIKAAVVGPSTMSATTTTNNNIPTTNATTTAANNDTKKEEDDFDSDGTSFSG
jgi:hypothetical protein